MEKRTVFFISDSTGITVEAVGNSVLTQFKEFNFDRITIPYVDSVTKAQEAVNRINQIPLNGQKKPLVFSSLLNPEVYKIIYTCDALVMDYLNVFMNWLQDELQTLPSQKVGETHAITRDSNSYDARISAINFSLKSDDGNNIKYYDKANIILLGVSRSGKTPTALYLALQFGIYAANYPLIEEDMYSPYLPKRLDPYNAKLFGLLIAPERLHQIREKRRPNSRYASLVQCRQELHRVKQMYENAKISYLDTTAFSIEEIATKIINLMSIERHSF